MEYTGSDRDKIDAICNYYGLPTNNIRGNEGGEWSICCPVHNDKNPSLNIKFNAENKGFLAHCKAGCNQDLIFEKIRIALEPFEILESNQSPRSKKKIFKVGDYYLRDGKEYEIKFVYTYKNENGTPIYQKLKWYKDQSKNIKDMALHYIDERFNKEHFYLYNLNNLKFNFSNGCKKTVCITEGEKDAETINGNEILNKEYIGTTVTIPSEIKGKKNNWKESYNSYLYGANILIFADNDATGKSIAGNIAETIFNAGVTKNIKIISFDEMQEKADITDYLLEHSIEDLKEKIAKAPLFDTGLYFTKLKYDEREIKKLPLDNDGNAKRIHYYSNGEIKVYSDDDKLHFYKYNRQDGCWEKSTKDAEALAHTILNDVIRAERQFYSKDELNDYEKFKLKVMENKTIKDSLQLLNKYEECKINKLDLNKHSKFTGDYYLNCLNGTIDLKTGELLEHSKDFKITQCINSEYIKGKESKLWQETLNKIFDGNQELIDWLQVYIGYIITGNPKEKSFCCLYSTAGDTGKSTFLDVIKNTLAGISKEKGYAGTLPYNVLEAGADKGDLNAPLADIKNCRLVTVSETTTGIKEKSFLNTEMIKNWSGSEILYCRDLYQKPEPFEPKFTLMMALNELPAIKDTKSSIWDRLKIIPFNHQFKGIEKDTALASKLNSKDEKMGILSWIIQGAVKYMQLGKLPAEPYIMQDMKRRYRSNESPLFSFLFECTKNYNLEYNELAPVKNKWISKDDLFEAIFKYYENKFGYDREYMEASKKGLKKKITIELRKYGIVINETKFAFYGIDFDEDKFNKITNIIELTNEVIEEDEIENKIEFARSEEQLEEIKYGEEKMQELFKNHSTGKISDSELQSTFEEMTGFTLLASND